MAEENFEKILSRGAKEHIYTTIKHEIMERDFKDEDWKEIDAYKRQIEEGFNKLVCDGTISDFKLNPDSDVDENSILTVNVQVRLNEPVRYCTIKESDFTGLSRDKFVEMCDEIKKEIEKP